jgi:hypothetical protein
LEDSKSRGSSDCAYCQRGAETKQLAKCWHCGNDQVKTVHCQKVISDCSCPPPQTNCGRCEKCRLKHQKGNQNENKEKWKKSYSTPTYFRNCNTATQKAQVWQFQQMQQQCLDTFNNFNKTNRPNLNSQSQTARKQYDPCRVNRYKDRRKKSR